MDPFMTLQILIYLLTKSFSFMMDRQGASCAIAAFICLQWRAIHTSYLATCHIHKQYNQQRTTQGCVQNICYITRLQHAFYKIIKKK
ncbi:hypothetical protein BC939DRAFT_202824 [Gamsiella multidivaricata]|uniref:uncharacterized protein n=1 Tax=Gamsiella multidivaricata TaxID=101098 RepID=UPI00221E89B1|nr:uncharacterized protein BC939DRAFT_202824 [Gamsiella multidivaricata]KAI7821746.1 hypothetical protein BC939DRAFT_202824 [Gamsiella multidivaricata]